MTTDTTAQEAAVERVLESLPRDLDVYEASKVAIATRAEIIAAEQRGYAAALKRATEQDCHLFKCGAAAILAEAQEQP